MRSSVNCSPRSRSPAGSARPKPLTEWDWPERRRFDPGLRLQPGPLTALRSCGDDSPMVSGLLDGAGILQGAGMLEGAGLLQGAGALQGPSAALEAPGVREGRGMP